MQMPDPNYASLVPCESFCSICPARALGTSSWVARMVSRYIYSSVSIHDNVKRKETQREEKTRGKKHTFLS